MTLGAPGGYGDLASRDDYAAYQALLGSPGNVKARRELVEKFAHLVRVAIGRLGAQLSPYLDETVLMGRGLIALFEVAEHHQVSSPRFEEVAMRRIVEDLRRSARSTEWFRSAWSERVAPLCATAAEALLRPVRRSLGEGGADGGLGPRFTEAGLVFGVSPERILPVAELSSAQRGQLAAVIDDLPAPQRTLLTAYFQERLSFPEIAELLELPPAHVQALYGRAAVAIRAALTARNGGNESDDSNGNDRIR